MEIKMTETEATLVMAIYNISKDPLNENIGDWINEINNTTVSAIIASHLEEEDFIDAKGVSINFSEGRLTIHKRKKDFEAVAGEILGTVYHTAEATA
ncbi:hypothetical protein ACFLZQ_08590 [Thermodesulfobacteriota bacterium]